MTNTKKILIGGASLLAAAGIAATTVIPAVAAASAPTTAAASPSASHARSGHSRMDARLARALVRATVKETGLSRQAVTQDLAAGKTLAQIAGPKTQAVENDVLAQVTARLDRASASGRISQAQSATRLAAAKAAIARLMDANLSTYLHGHASPSATTTSA